MIVSQFGVESWMDQYEEGAKYNITDTCAKPLSLAELFSLAGEDRTDFMDRFFEREQTYGTIFGSEKVKKEISRLYLSIRPEEILTEHGATGGNQHIFFSLIRPGGPCDRILSKLSAVLLGTGSARGGGDGAAPSKRERLSAGP